MLVTIVAVGLPDGSGLDVSRLEKVEDLEPEIGQKMLDGGTAREPSTEELAEYRKTIKANSGIGQSDAKPTAPPEVQPDVAEPEPLATPPTSE